MYKIIGIGEYSVSNNPSEIIKTFALSSCVAITAYCPQKKAAGMVHVALPAYAGNEVPSKCGYYAPSGIAALIGELYMKYGCKKEELIIQIYGGANSIIENDIFKIGEKNISAVVEILSDLGLAVQKAEVGGFVSRTVELHVATGEVNISTLPLKY